MSISFPVGFCTKELCIILFGVDMHALRWHGKTDFDLYRNVYWRPPSQLLSQTYWRSELAMVNPGQSSGLNYARFQANIFQQPGNWKASLMLAME